MTILPEPPVVDWAELSRAKRYEEVLRVIPGCRLLPTYGVVGGVCTCGLIHSAKANLTGKHPSIDEWPTRASNDLAHVNGWLAQDPESNMAMVCFGSGILVMDFDIGKGGLESWQSLLDLCGHEIPDTVKVLTGNGTFGGQSGRGFHLYFKMPVGYKFPANLARLGFPGVDIRGNAYVLIPGSSHHSGVDYEWAPGRAPWEIEIAEMPIVLLEGIAKQGTVSTSYSSRSTIGDDDWQDSWTSLMSQKVPNTPYAQAALDRTCKELAAMSAGMGRNNALNAATFSLGHLIGGRQLDYQSTKICLREAMKKAYGKEFPVKESNVELTLRDWGGGFECGAVEPKYPVELDENLLSWASEQFGTSRKAEEEQFIELARTGFFGDGGLQRKTLEKAVNALGLICSGPGKTLWHFRDGRWQQNGMDEVIRRVDKLLGEKGRKAHSEQLIHFMQAAEPEIKGLGPKEYLNVQNGMLNWKTGELLPHGAEYYSSVQLSTYWDPTAECPTVDGFMEQMIHDDLVDLIWEIIGVCIYTGIGFQRAIFLSGTGRNGKGTILRLIRNLVPQEFVASVELQRFSTDKFAHAQLFNKIVNIVGDLSSKAMQDSGMFKQLTGQDQVSAEFKYGQAFNFTSEATLIFAANEMPGSPDTTTGFFERMLIVPFDKKSLKREEIDQTLEPRMAQELPGVLRKAVAGLQRAMKRGNFQQVQRCEDAISDYIGTSSEVAPWIAKNIVVTGEPSDRVPRKQLFELYLEHCRKTNAKSLDITSFYRRFESESGPAVSFIKSGNNRDYSGVKLLNPSGPGREGS